MALITKHRPSNLITKASAADDDEELAIPLKKKAPSQDSLLTLPTEFTEPISDLGDATILFYGEKKIGKTLLASKFPDALFMHFEPGGKGLRLKSRRVTAWKEFKQYVKLLQASTDFRTVVVDTVDAAYERCFEYVCKLAGVKHPSDDPAWGAIWKQIVAEFVTEMQALMATERGVIFVSHADEKEFQERTGGNYTKLVPSMSKQARSFLVGIVDITAYLGYYGEERYITIAGSDSLEAGHRLEERFWAKNAERVHSVPMGESANEAYENFVRAFDNKQASSGRPEDDETGLSEKPAKRDRKDRR